MPSPPAGIWEALVLLTLFLAQFYPPFQQYEGLLLFSGLYVVLGLALLVARRKHLPSVIASVRRYGFSSHPQPTTED